MHLLSVTSGAEITVADVSGLPESISKASRVADDKMLVQTENQMELYKFDASKKF